MSTIKVAGHDYRVGKLGAIPQFHVARRLIPILAVMGITAHQLMQGLGEGGVEDFLPLLGPISEVVAKMSDAESEYVIFTCLGAVERAIVVGSDVRYQPVTAAGHQLVFQDMDMPTMLRLVVEVVRDNLGGFLTGLGEEARSPSS